MSRIEKAMEKAARLREQDVDAVPAVPPPAEREAPAAPPVFTPPERTLTPSHPFLVNLLDPRSPAAEEYRKLKGTLVKLTKGEKFRNTLMVTSAVPNEGKSLTALNLAISLAQELDYTVLLIDGDLRRPSLHRYLDVEEGPGLGDVLLGEADIPETLVATGIGKLSIMRAGRPVENPAELFSSQKMRGLVEEMKNRYPDRFIIFDTPPLLPFAETRSLANLVDGVLFVVMERLASQANIREGIESLKGCPLLGIVYNAATLGESDHTYYYYRESGPEKAKARQ
ncbi:XrtA-associated tyrosine autokinase [Geomesophilobacter sediminis]|uniref:Tyrosine-protein kinase family protein n=1 Tax=Geomesophilobacter sediminis TaxID=2798584 RepID=A0A8J7LUF2_9BACT|nr:XrtA-associated tyrosine autokinase [Geomesophilobacter sediminis]MBJ6723670.1 tyrosine-protein kinase family protein [Geomesophilobacter sediminis]